MDSPCPPSQPIWCGQHYAPSRRAAPTTPNLDSPRVLPCPTPHRPHATTATATTATPQQVIGVAAHRPRPAALRDEVRQKPPHRFHRDPRHHHQRPTAARHHRIALRDPIEPRRSSRYCDRPHASEPGRGAPKTVSVARSSKTLIFFATASAASVIASGVTSIGPILGGVGRQRDRGLTGARHSRDRNQIRRGDPLVHCF